MKKKFSTAWKASKQPRKQRKYAAHAPLHIRKKLMNVNLSKDLRKTQGKRAVRLRRGDTVLVKKGKFKGTKGKVLSVKLKTLRVEIEGIQVKKQDGSKTNVRLKPHNLQIVELNSEGRKRKGTIGKAPAKENTRTIEEKSAPKKENKKSTKKTVEKNAS